jgi:hypothetical protein
MVQRMKAYAASSSIINRVSEQVIQINQHGNHHETISFVPVLSKEDSYHNRWHAKMK